jgi:hypothetical protein
MKPFGFRTFFKGKKSKNNNSIKIFHNGGEGYVSVDEIKINKEVIDKHKVFISRGYGAGESFPHQILNKPFYGEPQSVCTETYIYIGPFKSKKICENVISYIKTKFFRFLVLMIKNSYDRFWALKKLHPKAVRVNSEMLTMASSSSRRREWRKCRSTKDRPESHESPALRRTRNTHTSPEP